MLLLYKVLAPWTDLLDALADAGPQMRRGNIGKALVPPEPGDPDRSLGVVVPYVAVLRDLAPVGLLRVT